MRIYAINEEGYAFFTGVNEDFIEFISKYIHKTNEIILLKIKSKLKEKNIKSSDKN